MATITGLTAARMLAIEAASVVDGEVVGDNLILTKHDASTIDAGNVRGSRANRNRIINGDFAVNQRGFTSTASADVYGLDRWFMSVIGGTVTYSAQTPALGDLPESAKAFARLVTSGQAAAGDVSILRQRIESVRTLSGKTATVSFWAKAASGTPKVSIELGQAFGTGGSPSADVNAYAGQVTLSTTWTRYSVSIAVPSIAGKTLGISNSDNLLLSLWTSAGSNYNARTGSLGIQNTTIDFWGVQVEEGSTLSPFEMESYGDNLRRCQRYYYRIESSAFASGVGLFSGSGMINGLGSALFAFQHPVKMRTRATSFGSGGGTSLIITDGISTVASNPTLSVSSYNGPEAAWVSATGLSGLTTHWPVALAANNTGAFVEFGAEL